MPATPLPDLAVTRLSWTVGGFDCGGCERRIRAFAEALPGASEVRTDIPAARLTLDLAEALTPRARVEAGLRKLGYDPRPLAAAVPDPPPAPAPVSSPAPVAAAAPVADGPPGAALAYRVGGLDCAACATKIEALAASLPGAAAVEVSFAAGRLRLRLDERLTPRTVLEARLRGMGYDPQPETAAAAAPAADHADQAPWFRTSHGRHVILTGGLIGLASVAQVAEPRVALAGFVAATLVGVLPLVRKAAAMARIGEYFSISMLVTLAATGALLIGEAEEGAIVVFLFLLGEMLEGVAARRARSGIRALAALTPRTALLVGDGGLVEVPAASLAVGQVIQVNPGARVAADGTIVAGRSSLDDSPVTGESVPVPKAEGDGVYAGSINTDGVLRVRVARAAADNTIARIIHLVEEAEAGKARTARFIDRFSRFYSPAVVALALLTAVLPPLVTGQPFHDWLYKGLALLLIGCPCALVISVPAAITSALYAGTRHGLLVKGGAALETIGKARMVAFDKTGTLTGGRPRVVRVLPLGDMPRATLLGLAAAVEQGSDHPLARAIVAAAAAEGAAIPAATAARATAGRAAHALVDGRDIAVGSPVHARDSLALPPGAAREIARLEDDGHTVVVVHDHHRALGLVALRDEPRADAAEAVARLARMGVGAVMLTGDNPRAAASIGAALGLEVRAGLMPAEKLAAIAGLRAAGPVVMVGDGINDAPALAAADVGVAMGSGTDVALETADAALMGGRVAGIADLVALGRATMANIRLNIALALGIKALFLVTTLTGTTNLWMAIFADTGATAIVTASALRLLGWSPRPAAAPGRRTASATIPGAAG